MAFANRSIHFFDLPDIVREKIFGYMSFEELAHLRIVCHRFDGIIKMLLNKGFRQVERYQAKCLKEVKSQLPRRESERRNHPLFRHCDILTAIETRLSLLNMTFMKYIDSQMCCFIPGKVIDEIYRVLWFIKSHKMLPRSHEILTELRDISSMAMEHFEEKIVSSLRPATLTPTTPRFSLSSSYASHSSSPGTSSASTSIKSHSLAAVAAADDFSDLTNNPYKISVITLRKEVSDMKSKFNEVRRKMSEQEKVALEHNRIISEQAIKLTGMEGKLAEMGRKLMEYEQRLNEVVRGGGTHTRDKKSGSRSSTSNKWGRNDSSQQFYVSHGLPSQAISPAVFVPTNIIQPNLVNLAAAPMPVRTYLPASSLPRFSGASPGQESSSRLRHTVTPPGFNSGHHTQRPLPRCSTPLSDTTSQADNNSVRGSTTSSEGESSDRQCKKHRKRKFLDEDRNNDSHSKQAKL